MWFFKVAVGFLFILPFQLQLQVVCARETPTLLGRSTASPITLPIRRLLPRAPADNATTNSGLSPVTMAHDRQAYFVVLQTGEISFRVALDTASADLWILASDCGTDTCRDSPRYPLSYASPTFAVVNGNTTRFSAGYADGTVVSGFVAQESVTLSNLTVPHQPFALITESNVTMTDQTSGVMGLGFSRLSSISASVTNSTPFFVSLAQQGLLDYPLFGVSLTFDAAGTLSIGAIDSSVVKNTSLIDWNPIAEFAPFSTESNTSSYLQWAVPLSGFSVGSANFTPQPTFPMVTGNKSLALIDIGAAGLYGPYADVSRIFGSITGARLVDQGGQWVIPCNTAVVMSFTFGEQTYVLQPADYMIGPAQGNPNLCLSWPRAQQLSADGIDWQIGTPFLRTVYSVFSYGISTKEPPMIGFYALSNNTTPASPDAAASVFSSLSATIPTTLPNFILPTPTYTTPAYTFNASVTAPIGGIVSSGLATSTYVPLLQSGQENVTALPLISPVPSITVITLTDAQGVVSTSTSTHSLAFVTLGVPPGQSAAGRVQIPSFLATVVPCLLVSWTVLLLLPDFIP